MLQHPSVHAGLKAAVAPEVFLAWHIDAQRFRLYEEDQLQKQKNHFAMKTVGFLLPRQSHLYPQRQKLATHGISQPSTRTTQFWVHRRKLESKQPGQQTGQKASFPAMTL